jgi:primosomal protein N' (replication factor Y)
VQTRVPEHEVLTGVARRDPLAITRAEAARRAALAYPPFGGLAAVAGDPPAVAALVAAVRDLPGVAVLGPVDDGRRALVRAAGVTELCDALATPPVDAARALGRLRIDVDGRRT